MSRPLATNGLLAAAALARMADIGALMATQQIDPGRKPGSQQHKARTRAMWALGDYHRFATELVWELGPILVTACDISAGQRVLDVAAGTGNVAIAAAEVGARVVASDLTPEHFESGRREARARGVTVEWVEGDAEDLPFEDDAFDVVTSAFGVMFAPDHRAAADELLRVCRPGGTIGLLNFTPEGLGGEFFGLFGRYAPPPPPGASPPLLWGSEVHVRELLGGRVASLELTRHEYVERASSPAAYCEFFKQTFGPVVAVYAGLADEPDRIAALDREFLDYVTHANRAAADGPAEYHYEYLLALARKRDPSRHWPPSGA